MKRHHYFMHIRRYMQMELSKIELTVWLHSVANGLVAVFIPILLLQAGFPLTGVILFLLLLNLFDVPLNFVARRLVLRIGAVKTILLSNLAVLVYFGLVGFGEYNWLTLVVLALAAAVYDSFYWVAHWFVFNEAVRSQKGVGKQVSMVMLARSLGSFLAPAIGVAFLIFFNKGYLILLSMAFFALSAITISSVKHDLLKPKKEKKLASFFKEKHNRQNFISTAFYAVHGEVEGTILPLAVFLAFGSIAAVGTLPVIAAFVAIIFVLFAGSLTDRLSKRFLIAFGAVCISIVWLVRLVRPELNVFYLTAFVVAFLAPLITVPLEAKLVQAGKKSGMLNAATYRNIAYMVTNVAIYSILFLSMEVLKVPFLEAALAMVLLAFFNSLLLLRKKHGIIHTRMNR